MDDKEKIDMLIKYYLRECDHSLNNKLHSWELSLIAESALKSFIYPLLEEGVLSIHPPSRSGEDELSLSNRFEILDYKEYKKSIGVKIK